MLRAALTVLVIGLTACAPSSREACVAEYATKATTSRMVGAAYSLCATAFKPDALPIARSRATCIVKQIPDLKADAAIQAVRVGCDAKYPIPNCPSGQSFSWTVEQCERTIIDPFDP